MIGSNSTDGGQVTLSKWSEDHPPDLIAGSIYVVPASQRQNAAEVLVAAGHWVHADIILDHKGQHVGVTPNELHQIRRALPQANIEVHFITLTPTAPEMAGGHRLAEVVTSLEGIRPQRVDIPLTFLQFHSSLVARLRDAGTEVRIVTDETMQRETIAAAGETVDGVLLMLIEPGTMREADPDLMRSIAELAPRGSVGVDGGVNSSIATTCFKGGASYIVSGRSLITVSPSGTENNQPSNHRKEHQS